METESIINKYSNYKILKISEDVFLVLLGFYLAELTLSNTVFSINVPEYFKLVLPLLFSIIVIPRIINQYRSKLLYAAIIISVVYYLGWDVDRLPLLAIITIGCVGISYKKIIKTFIISVSLVLGVTVLIALGDGITNVIHIRNGHLRDSLGVIYPTDFAALVFFITLAIWISSKYLLDIVSLAFLIFSIWVSVYLAQGRTSAICSILILGAVFYLFFEKKIIENNILSLIKKAIDILLVFCFPILTILFMFFTWAYTKGYSIAYLMDKLLSTRLKIAAQSFAENTITAFGYNFEQIGLGNIPFGPLKYTFLDSSYPKILLTYGIVTIVMFCILWPCFTKRALENNQRKLAFALAIIALDSVLEHHFMQIYYNIFIVLPFADLSNENNTSYSDVMSFKELKKVLKANYMYLICFIITLATIPYIMPKYRIWLLCCDNQLEMIVSTTLFLMYWLLMIWGICSSIKYHNKFGEFKYIRIILSIFVLFAIICCLYITNKSIKAKQNEYSEILNADERALNAVLKEKEGKVYVYQLGDFYTKEYNGICSNTILDGEDLARFNNTSVIVDKSLDSNIFKKKAFMYSEISDYHGIYTNDESVIRTLKDEGFRVSSYNYSINSFDLKEIASKNLLPMENGERIVLKDSTYPLVIGWNPLRSDNNIYRAINLFSGKYIFSFDLKINPDSYENDYKVCHVLIDAYGGEKPIRKLDIYRSWFDENGILKANISFLSGGYPKYRFMIVMENDEMGIISNCILFRSPDYDVHITYGEHGRMIRSDYYDQNGNPVVTDEGFSSIKYEYNDRGIVDTIRYYDMDDELVNIEEGYACIHRVFDIKGRCIREEYLNTSNELVRNIDGYAIREWDYDINNNAVEQRFFNENSKFTETIYGFAGVKREFDEEHRIIQEKYLGEDGKFYLNADGYAGINKYYNEEEIVPLRIEYIDIDDKPIKISKGYTGIELQYEGDIIISEEYIDFNKKPVMSINGYSHREYLYDFDGNIWKCNCYDMNGKLVSVINDYEEPRNLYSDEINPKMKFGYIPE